MFKKTLSFLLTFALLFSVLSQAFAVVSIASFSTDPDEQDMQLIDDCQKHEVPSAWIVDNSGNKHYVEPQNLNKIGTRSFTDGSILWRFERYEQSVTKANDYQHFLGHVSLRNDFSIDPIPIKYIQQDTVTSNWTATGKIEAEAEFKVAVLAKLRAQFGLSLAVSKTTLSSTTVEIDLKVPYGQTGKISKYHGGKYSGGQGVWKGENVHSGQHAGYYYEEASAWGIATNEINYDVTGCVN